MTECMHTLTDRHIIYMSKNTKTGRFQLTYTVTDIIHYSTQLEPQLACFYSLQVSLVLIQLIGLYIAVAEIFLVDLYFIPFFIMIMLNMSNI